MEPRGGLVFSSGLQALQRFPFPHQEMVNTGGEGGVGGEKEAKATRLLERAKAAHDLLLLASAVRLLEASLILGAGGLGW